MPYIKQEERTGLDPIIDSLSKKFTHVGQLNYIITRLCHNWILKFGKRYVYLNAVMGVLSCVAREFNRVIIAPYEDEKIIENGGITALDIPDPDYRLPFETTLSSPKLDAPETEEDRNSRQLNERLDRFANGERTNG